MASRLDRVRRSYERAHVVAGLRGAAIAGALTVLAVGLHRTTDLTWLVVGTLAITLGVLGWRGGATRRGSLAGVIAGLPPMIAPGVFSVIVHGGHCPSCATSPSLGCVLTCLVTSAAVGIAVGARAARDASPRRYALSAMATASLTGALGCGTTGLGGSVGIVVGLVAGGVTGWISAERRLITGRG